MIRRRGLSGVKARIEATKRLREEERMTPEEKISRAERQAEGLLFATDLLRKVSYSARERREIGRLEAWIKAGRDREIERIKGGEER